MGYPLVPGYESVGRVVAGRPARRAGRRRPRLRARRQLLRRRARPVRRRRGARGGAGQARGDGQRDRWAKTRSCWPWPPPPTTRCPAAASANPIVPPDLIVGHGVLGRLLARLTVARRLPDPVVWETEPQRAQGAQGYTVLAPRRRHARATTAPSTTSAATPSILDTLIGRLAPGGEIVLAGFYSERCPSPSRRPSCARRRSAPPPNGSAPTCWP